MATTPKAALTFESIEEAVDPVYKAYNSVLECNEGRLLSPFESFRSFMQGARHIHENIVAVLQKEMSASDSKMASLISRQKMDGIIETGLKELIVEIRGRLGTLAEHSKTVDEQGLYACFH